MIQLLIPVYRGEVEYVYPHNEEYERWAYERSKHILLRKFEDVGTALFYDPLDKFYCLNEYAQFIVNEKLKEGFVIVGMENNCWIVTKRENTIP